MKRTDTNQSDVDRDERLINDVLGSEHRDAFDRHVDQATRNLSVEVHAALVARQRKQKMVRFVAMSGVGIASAVAALFFFLPRTPSQLNIVPVSSTQVAGSDEVNMQGTDLLSDLITQESVDQLVGTTAPHTLIVTKSDVDHLLEGM